jgi:hypothetical protein
MFKKYGKWMLGIGLVQAAIGTGLYLEPCHDSGLFFGTCRGWTNLMMIFVILPIYAISDVVMVCFGQLGYIRKWSVFNWLMRSLMLTLFLIVIFLLVGYKWITR